MWHTNLWLFVFHFVSCLKNKNHFCKLQVGQTGLNHFGKFNPVSAYKGQAWSCDLLSPRGQCQMVQGRFLCKEACDRIRLRESVVKSCKLSTALWQVDPCNCHVTCAIVSCNLQNCSMVYVSQLIREH